MLGSRLLCWYSFVIPQDKHFCLRFLSRSKEIHPASSYIIARSLLFSELTRSLSCDELTRSHNSCDLCGLRVKCSLLVLEVTSSNPIRRDQNFFLWNISSSLPWSVVSWTRCLWAFSCALKMHYHLEISKRIDMIVAV